MYLRNVVVTPGSAGATNALPEVNDSPESKGNNQDGTNDSTMTDHSTTTNDNNESEEEPTDAA